MVLMKKYYEGVVPNPSALTVEDNATLEALKESPNIISTLLEQYKFRAASQEMMQLARIGNKYLAEEEPWKLIKTAPERVATIMHTAIQVVAGLAILCEPFMPKTANTLRNMLNLGNLVGWNDVGNKALISGGHVLGKTALLFEKIEDDAIAAQLEKLKA
jgi:methionyl-tRNA synthetase